jgi:hypothetical protein
MKYSWDIPEVDAIWTKMINAVLMAILSQEKQFQVEKMSCVKTLN